MNEAKYEKIWAFIQFVLGTILASVGYFVLWPMLMIIFIIGLFLMIKGFIDFIRVFINKK